MKRLQTACDKSAVRNITEDTFLDVITDNKFGCLMFFIIIQFTLPGV